MGKKRPFDFDDTVRREARLRQFGLCAHCGDSLTDQWEEAHHAIPNQSGDPNHPAHAWLRTVDNCVVLCDLCHHVAHAENTRTGAVAPPEFYEYSHGLDRVQHAAWAARLNLQAALLWGSKVRSSRRPK